MTRSRPILLAACVLVACGKAPPPAAAGKPADTPAADKKPADRPEPVDRSQTPLHTVKDSVGDIAFSLDIPVGELKRDARGEYVNWSFTDGNPFTSPSITVKPATAPKDLDAFARSAVGASMDVPPLVVATRRELEGGGMLVGAERSDGQYFTVHAIVRSGDRALRCSVLHRTGTGAPGDRPIPNFAASKAWAEKICTSLKLD